jgi:mono/diheme cytochrome c family protein
MKIVAIAFGVLALVQTASTGNVANGKRVFDKDGCYECHGYAGQGGRDGARIAQTTMPQAGFMRYVRRPTGAMPAFTQKVLPDQDLADIYAFLKSLPSAKPASEIPLLSRSRIK